MEKVKITQEQADAIEFALNESEYFKDNPDRLFRDCIASHVSFHSELYALNNLDVVKLAKVLFVPNGYEVEPEFKVGDFVDIGLFGISKVAEVTGVNGKLIAINGSDEYHEFKINRVLTDEEKQEEKQRRWWKKHGRKVWELKENDSILNQSEHDWYPDIIKSTNEFNVELSDREYIPWHLVKRDYKVFCFAEDRKDIKQ